MHDGHDYKFNAVRDAWEAESKDLPTTPPIEIDRAPKHNEVRRIAGELRRFNAARKQWESIHIH